MLKIESPASFESLKLRDRIPTVRGLASTSLFAAGVIVGSVHTVGDRFIKLVQGTDKPRSDVSVQKMGE